MTRTRWIAASALAIALGSSFIKEAGGTKPPPPPAGSTLLAMTDNSPAGGAVAISQDGGIYVGQSKIWTRVGTTPSAPADIWTRPSTGEVFIALANGDTYRLESNRSLTFDSNVFTSTGARLPDFPAFATPSAGDPATTEDDTPDAVSPAAVKAGAVK